MTVLFVDHDIEEAVSLADRVIALGGKPGEVRASLEIDLGRRGGRRLERFAEQIKADLAAEAAARSDWMI